jgi:hypothetical protein
MAITWEPYFLTLLLIDFALCAFIYLITWRIARRFGWRGLAEVRSAMPSGFVALKLVHRGHRGPENHVGAKDSKTA